MKEILDAPYAADALWAVISFAGAFLAVFLFLDSFREGKTDKALRLRREGEVQKTESLRQQALAALRQGDVAKANELQKRLLEETMDIIFRRPGLDEHITEQPNEQNSQKARKDG